MLLIRGRFATRSKTRETPGLGFMNDTERLQTIILASPLLRPILDDWEKVALADGWLAGGSIAQTVWNSVFGFPPLHGISDVDIAYFDPADLSEAAEAQHTARIHDALALPVRIDVKNEARVHLWYAAKYGYAIPPYTSATNAIATFPTTATAVGIQPGAERLTLHAPYGLTDLLGAIVRPNKTQITRDIYEAKTARWKATWPDLAVIGWDEEPC